MSEKNVTLSPQAISTDGMQVRIETSREHIDDLAELFDSGSDSPCWPSALAPADVFWDGKTYWLADGHHRFAAAVDSGCIEIRVRVHQGTKSEALLFACGANANGVMRRTNRDKQNALRVAWSIMPGIPARTLAKLCAVSHYMANEFVNSYKPSNVLPKNSLPAESKLTDSVNFDSAGRECESESNTQGDSDSRPLPESPDIKKDCAGLGIRSEASLAAFESLDIFAELDRHISQTAKLIDELGKAPGAEHLRKNYLKLTRETRDGKTVERLHSLDLENLRRELKNWRPYASVCPSCKGDPNQACKICYGLPYVIRQAWDRSPEKLRASLPWTHQKKL